MVFVLVVLDLGVSVRFASDDADADADADVDAAIQSAVKDNINMQHRQPSDLANTNGR